ncbi:YetF domain-containing protein [Paenibacillus chartarius]|uniref:YetF domain-containing protein n=1 Tax=Paenibacillus chartarius TaxID=747481 RepID=A0ABV6DIT8_9BACL
MGFLAVFLRTVVMYVVVFMVLRMMGKREIGKLSLFDLVISIMIAEIAVFVLEDMQRPLSDAIYPMLILVAIQITMAYLSLKSKKLRDWVDGKPSYVIENGKLNREEMAKQRYNLDDLLLQLRENRVANVADVEFAILEPSGKLTTLTKEEFGKAGSAPAAASREPSGQERRGEAPPGPPAIRYEGLPLPLIMDGKVQDDNLAKLGKTRFWLKNEIQAKGAKDFKEVFFCSIDHRGRIFMDRKR